MERVNEAEYDWKMQNPTDDIEKRRKEKKTTIYGKHEIDMANAENPLTGKLY